MFFDGQSLECGCAGIVSCDSENPAEITLFEDGPCSPSAVCWEYQ